MHNAFSKRPRWEISRQFQERKYGTVLLPTGHWENLMRTKAIYDAKLRAIALTKSLNQSVGLAIHIVDAENINQQLQGRMAGIQIRGISTFKSGYDDLPKIEFEKIKIVSNINVKFILK